MPRCTPAGRGRSASTPVSRPPRNSNAFYRRNLAAGQKGLSVAFDLATHRGYDSDHPRVVGDVGKAGVAIDTVEDMKILFDGIPLDHDVGVDDDERRGDPDPGLLHRRRGGAGRRQAQLDGTIQNDILKEFMVRNTYIYPPAPCMRIVSRHHRLLRGPHAEVQLDLDLRLSHARGRGDGGAGARLHHCRRQGIREAGDGRGAGASTTSPPRLSFFFGIGMNFFMEVAKLRAARTLWYAVMEGLGAKYERCKMLRTHCQTSGRQPAGAGPVQQRHPHHDRGDGGRARRHAVPPHQRARRGDRAADRLLRAHRPQHAACARGGDAASPRSSIRWAVPTTSRR